MLRATTKQIAKLAGVSQPTVSQVLCDRWREKRISRQTCERVRQAARRLNYRPNLLVRSLQTGRSHTVALMLPTIAHSFFPHIAAGVEAAAKQRGYHVLLSHVAAGLEDEVGEIETLLERRVDGLIISPRHGPHNREKYRQLLREGFPLVFVNDYFADVPGAAVIGDDFAGMYRATTHLIELGHRRIGHLAGSLGQTTTQLRIDGYRQALQDHGLRAAADLVQGFGYSVQHGQTGMQRLLARRERPTAVVGGNDEAALGGIKAAWEAGLRVPQDVAFVGYGDDLEETWFDRLQLTTVRVDAEEMGRRALAILLEEMRAPARKKAVEKLPADLVIRESCGAKRS